MENKSKLIDFIKSKELMVISSINSEGKPQSAVVGFGITDDMELVFGTSIKSRKAQNILSNPEVSAVIGWDRDGTIQYEGKAYILEGENIDKYSEVYFTKNPHARRHKDNPDEGYFLVKPSLIRLTEVEGKPWTVSEIKF